jgi:hypothetical protein
MLLWRILLLDFAYLTSTSVLSVRELAQLLVPPHFFAALKK